MAPRASVPLRGRITASHGQMLDALARIAERAAIEFPFEGDDRARRLRAEVAQFDVEGDPVGYVALLFRTGEDELRIGHADEALRFMTQGYALAEELSRALPPETRHFYCYRLGVACMRLGETQNCCAQSNAESCILPIRGGGIHTRESGSRRAVHYFTRVLQATAPDATLHRKARWLLNIAYMTLGAYPHQVPREYLIPPEAFASEEDFPRFANIAPQLGLDLVNRAGGAVCDDFDGDGYLDLMISQMDVRGQMRLLHNNGDGTFSDRTAEAALGGLTGGLNMVQTDYNNDGWIDVYVIRGAWYGKFGQYPDSLLRNNGDGTFTDETFAAGMGQARYPSQTAAWADYDGDGDLDLFVGGESNDMFQCACQLFRNEGDGTLVDVAQAAGVTNDRFTKGCCWGDYDGDDRPDLYVSNLGGENRLYRNRGDGSFTDVAPRLGVTRPQVSFPTWFWDFDNDGALDLWVSTYLVSPDVLSASCLGLPHDHELHCLYRGDGHGGFVDVTLAQNLSRPAGAMGCNFGDLDNDGFLDFYLGTGDPDYETLTPNVMFHNRGGAGFADVTTAGGFGHLQKGHGVAFADLDQDGDQDVFQEMGGALLADGFANVLYQNPGFGNHWIAVRLIGSPSNRAALGARIRVEIVENGQRRSIYKHVNSGGSFGCNPFRQTIGLGRADRIEALEIHWPTTGRTQVLRDLPLDATVQVLEGRDQATVWRLPAFKFRLQDR